MIIRKIPAMLALSLSSLLYFSGCGSEDRPEKQEDTAVPFIVQRADPYVVYNEDDGFYYFTSSWPAYRDAGHGYAS